MGTENSKIHPKRAPRSLLGVVFFRLRDFESHNLSIELRGRTVLATGAGVLERGSYWAGKYIVTFLATVPTESEYFTARLLGFCQVPNPTGVEFHRDCPVGCLRGNTKTACRGSRCFGRRCRRGDRSRNRSSGRNGPGKRTGCGLRWRRSGSRTLEASFEETSIEPDGEVLEVEVGLGLANWGDLVFDVVLQIRVGIRAGRVGHQALYRPDTTISGTRSISNPVRWYKSRADLKFSPVPTQSRRRRVRYRPGINPGTRVLPGSSATP
jgi:hypothetical protein